MHCPLLELVQGRIVKVRMIIQGDRGNELQAESLQRAEKRGRCGNPGKSDAPQSGKSIELLHRAIESNELCGQPVAAAERCLRRKGGQSVKRFVAGENTEVGTKVGCQWFAQETGREDAAVTAGTAGIEEEEEREPE